MTSQRTAVPTTTVAPTATGLSESQPPECCKAGEGPESTSTAAQLAWGWTELCIDSAKALDSLAIGEVTGTAPDH